MRQGLLYLHAQRVIGVEINGRSSFVEFFLGKMNLADERTAQSRSRCEIQGLVQAFCPPVNGASAVFLFAGFIALFLPLKFP